MGIHKHRQDLEVATEHTDSDRFLSSNGFEVYQQQARSYVRGDYLVV